jgi:hypothetical protein
MRAVASSVTVRWLGVVSVISGCGGAVFDVVANLSGESVTEDTGGSANLTDLANVGVD